MSCRDRKCIVGVMEVDLFLCGSRSLKEKRRIIQSLRTRLKNNFNISVTESDALNLWQRAKIVISSAGEKIILEKIFKNICEIISNSGTVNIINTELEYY